MKFARAPRRLIGRTFRGLRDRATASAPDWLGKRIDPTIDTMDMLLVDHGIFRLIYANRHRLGPNVWRMAQPTPGDLRWAAARGVRTVLNLRGERNCGAFRLETRACAAEGLRLENFIVRSRAAPERQTILEAKALFNRLEYPILMHCKSGADRVGLMSVLYLIFMEGIPVVEAKRQLSWRYGHFSQADTGILDAFFESYVAYNRSIPMPFLEWVANVYDPQELRNSFKAGAFANVWVNAILRRE
jgi:protein tyrosine phosphatase (PTP) superfamily phosphohydrolase (DUF442 family)